MCSRPRSPITKPEIYIIMEEIFSVSENNEIIGLRNFHRLLFGFRLQTPQPVNHPGTATTTTTEKFEIFVNNETIRLQFWQFSMMRYNKQYW